MSSRVEKFLCGGGQGHRQSLLVFLFLASILAVQDIGDASIVFGADHPRSSSKPNTSLATSAEQQLPALIRVQPDAIKIAWLEAEQAIAENKTLIHPHPEPYFARAEIWSSAGNHDDAIKDLLVAIELVANSGADQATLTFYYSKVYKSLQNVELQPRPPVDRDNFDDYAMDHFAAGIPKFWANDLHGALQDFNNAVQLAPAKPFYWYYRALTYRRLGNTDMAHHDVQIGAHLERASGIRPLGTSFYRLQGPDRTWLENQRLVDVAQ